MSPKMRKSKTLNRNQIQKNHITFGNLFRKKTIYKKNKNANLILSLKDQIIGNCMFMEKSKNLQIYEFAERYINDRISVENLLTKLYSLEKVLASISDKDNNYLLESNKKINFWKEFGDIDK